MRLLASTMESRDGVEQYLDKWKGKSARLYSYTLSLSILEIAVTKRGFEKGIMIQCLGVNSIAAPVGWPSSEFSIEPIDNRRFGLFSLRDIRAGVKIICADVAIVRFEEAIKSKEGM